MNSFEVGIKNRLLSLPEKGRILFSILTCEKLYPHYVAFERKYGWGNSEILASGISLVYEYLINRDIISKEDIQNMISEIDLATPDTEDFGELLGSFALNAATAIYSTLQYLLTGNINDIMDVVVYTFDTIDLFIQEKENMSTLDPSREIQIENDGFMIAEREKETDLIHLISKMDNIVITDSLLDTLRSDSPIIDLSLLNL